jgi:hypothetical protein
VTLAGLEPATSPAPGEQGRSIPLELQRRHDFHDRLWRRKGGHLWGFNLGTPCEGMTERRFPPPWLINVVHCAQDSHECLQQ